MPPLWKFLLILFIGVNGILVLIDEVVSVQELSEELQSEFMKKIIKVSKFLSRNLNVLSLEDMRCIVSRFKDCFNFQDLFNFEIEL